jgi:diguanylate cyclase (GGDEF)-like protein
MKAPTRFLVAGSAHLDILSTISGDDSTLDKIGSVAIDIGGTACNIALNLRQLGAPVSLLTASNNSPYSMFVTNHLSQRGINVLVERNDALPLAAFNAHISASGEMVGAVSSTPVDKHHFDVATIELAIDAVDCVILDCNLSEESLLQIAGLAGERMIPVYLAGVSEEKCLRAASVSAFAEAIFLNKREADYLAKHIAPATAGRYGDLAGVLGTTLVITDGESGAFVARPATGSSTRIVPPSLRDAKNFLGMGDAFMAGTLYAHLDFDFNLEMAALAMIPMVAKISELDSCNEGTAGIIEKMLGEMRQRAYVCPTTRILNRSATEEELEKMILGVDSVGGQFSVAIVDVDHFKTINDTLGHNVGDTVLERVAEALRSVLRGNDVVGRWGGDEFLALMLSDADISVRVAERMQEAVKIACADIYPVTLSIGVAQWNEGMCSAKELVEAADKGLYSAKRGGRNRVEGVLSEALAATQQIA